MMTTKTIYLFLFDSLSDWEIGYVTAGINNPMMQRNPKKYQLKTFSLDGKPITTIGGLKITPGLSLNEVTTADSAMLILPGGSIWEKSDNKEIIQLTKKFHENQIKIAAICGATLGLAKCGLLDAVQHTSNSKDYILSSCYKGSALYVNQLAVSCGGIITAAGTAPLEFARDIFKELNLYKDEVLAAWYKLFKTSLPEAFAELMNALQL